MAISVRKWTQKRLLYPIAIFAIIAPTVIMGLFGAYALRVVELRPDNYKDQLQEIQLNLDLAIELKLSALRVEFADSLPGDASAAGSTTKQVQDYLADYDHALASRAWIGVGSEVQDSVSAEGSPPVDPPSELLILLGKMAVLEPDNDGVARRTLVLRHSDGTDTEVSAFIVFRYVKTGAFVVWEVNRLALQDVVDKEIADVSLKLDTLEATRMSWKQLSDEDSGGRYETVGFAPIHEIAGASDYVVLRLDADRQLFDDNKFLSHIFILIAVLAVPIVASATLMVVRMILREASEARKKVGFVANVTHELKTPLTSIRMYAETLKLGRVKNQDQIEACLDTIMSESARLGILIDHILSFSKMENQVKVYNFYPASLAKVVRDTVTLFRAQMKGEDGDIMLKITPGLPLQAEMDKDAIREVVLNLLSNAIKYSGDEKFVTVLVGVDRQNLFIEVADRGIGIDMTDHDRIYDKFFRVDEALTRRVEGTGLGLAICKEIVQAHKGRIVVESARGKGSRFTVYIPYKGVGIKRPITNQMKMP